MGHTEFTLEKIAQIIDGYIVCKDQQKKSLIARISSLEDAGPRDITFAQDASFLDKAGMISAGAVIVPHSFDRAVDYPLIKVNNPRYSFFKLVEIFHPPPEVIPGINPRAVIGSNVKLGQNVAIDANVVVGDNTVIGDNVHIMANTFIGSGCLIGTHTLIKPNVTVLDLTRIGSRSIIHSGTVIGSDGYGFTRQAETHEKLIHIGYVEIGDNVEIGACNTIDRGTLGATSIGDGVKTDNQVHIAHNVKIGNNTLIVAQVGIAGSTKVGRNVIIAGKAGISGHLKIGDNVIVGPYTGVSADVKANQVVSGIPHMPHKIWLKAANILYRLPEIRKRLLALERDMKRIKPTVE